MKLSKCKLFHGIDPNNIEALLNCLSAKEKTYRKGETILHEGETIEVIGIVLSGMAMITSSDYLGNNSILGHAGPGAVFAEAYACVPNEPLRICVIADQDCTILFLNVKKIITTCTNSCVFHTQLIQNLMTLCAYKSLQLSSRILHTRSKSIRGRLLSYFSECSKIAGSHDFTIPYSRQQLADYLGVDRSAMSNELSKMQKAGLIEYHKNQFRLSD